MKEIRLNGLVYEYEYDPIYTTKDILNIHENLMKK